MRGRIAHKLLLLISSSTDHHEQRRDEMGPIAARCEHRPRLSQADAGVHGG